MRISHTSPEGRYGSPNYVPTMLFNMLRRLQSGPNALVGGKKSRVNNGEETVQDAMAAVFIGVNVVETFMNIYFKIFAEENKSTPYHEKFNSDLTNYHFGLQQKITKWPELCFGRRLDPADRRYVQFEALKSLRNSLTHFKSTHTTIVPTPGVIIEGAVDLKVFSSLNVETLGNTVSTVSEFIELILETRGLSPDQIKMDSHFWIGFG